jgi:hypothetical protein
MERSGKWIHAAVIRKLRIPSLTPSHTRSAGGLTRWLRGRFRHYAIRFAYRDWARIPASQPIRIDLCIPSEVSACQWFQKKSKSGIATPKADIELIRQRLKQAVEISKKQEE